MGKLTAKANKSFMLGSFVMIILLFLTVFIFLMWAFKAFEKREQGGYKDRYELVLGQSTLGAGMMLYVNDSLVFNGTPASEMTLTVGRFAEESTLLCVDAETDQVSLIGLPQESATIRIEKEGTEFYATNPE